LKYFLGLPLFLGSKGKDTYGFSALPGGYRDSDGEFLGVNNDYALWWSASEFDYDEFLGVKRAITLHIVECSMAGYSFFSTTLLLSVRCVQD
jgi:uncharacterized protein (TIGR02145 family)